MHQSMPMIYIYKWDSRDTLIEQSDIEQFDSRIVEIIRRDRYYLRRITHLNNFVHSTVVQCSLHHVSSHEQTVSSVLCNCAETVFFCATYAFILFLFFFSLFFLFHFFPPMWRVSLGRPWNAISMFAEDFFFLVGKHQIFETNKSSIESMFKARCRRTNDRVISDRWRCAIRQLYIRSCSTSNPIFLRSERARRIYGRFFFFFPLRLFENNLTAGILVKVIFQYFDTKIPQNKIDPIIDYSFSLFHKELHNVIESKSHDNTLYRCCLKVKDGEL